eukprot:6214766-Pleurochrysis_carterae.AAC.2
MLPPCQAFENYHAPWTYLATNQESEAKDERYHTPLVLRVASARAFDERLYDWRSRNAILHTAPCLIHVAGDVETQQMKQTAKEERFLGESYRVRDKKRRMETRHDQRLESLFFYASPWDPLAMSPEVAGPGCGPALPYVEIVCDEPRDVLCRLGGREHARIDELGLVDRAHARIHVAGARGAEPDAAVLSRVHAVMTGASTRAPLQASQRTTLSMV